jgi:hypothetical protein
MLLPKKAWELDRVVTSEITPTLPNRRYSGPDIALSNVDWLPGASRAGLLILAKIGQQHHWELLAPVSDV